MRARRAQETRAALLDAGATLFSTRGWVSTSMRDVAREAGVATETLYAHFSSKRALLQAVIDIAVVGDEQPVAVADRPEFAALGQGRRAERIAAAAHLTTSIHERTSAFAKVLREAAPSNPEIAEMLDATRRRQRQDVQAGVGLVIGRAPSATEVGEIWALLSPEVYLLLVEESGWAVAQYEQWVAQTLERVLARS
jgi:AcrR family transcriptional regulator